MAEIGLRLSPQIPAKAPRVLHLLNELCVSGAELMLVAGAGQLGAVGSTVLSTGKQCGSSAGALQQAGFRVNHLPFARSPWYFLQLLAFIRRGRFDVVHVHPERARLWHTLVARMCGVPVVTTLHSEFTFDGALRWRKRLGRQLARLAGARFVACSRRVARNEAERFGLDPQVILNWSDAARIKPADEALRRHYRSELGLPATAFVTVSIANESPAKNLYALADAVAAGPPDHYHLHLGLVTDRFAALAQQRAGDRMVLCGQVAGIDHYLCAGDAFVCSSLFEGGPLALIEAALAGLPCVTTEVGIAEEFRDQPGVFFVAPEGASIEAGIARVRAMTAKARMAAGEALAAQARRNHLPAAGAAHYAALYRQLAGQVPSGAAV